MALESAIQDRATAGRAVAVLVLVGVVNLPIIKYSVSGGIPSSTGDVQVDRKTSDAAEMWMPLLVRCHRYLQFLDTVFFTNPMRSWSAKSVRFGSVN